jgi:hypothetical protein
MYSHRSKRNIVTFKGLLAALYFILFISQLSHKFYLYANSPSGLLKLYELEFSQASIDHSRPALLKHEKQFSLSVDKRYRMADLFALFSAEVMACLSGLELDRWTCSLCPIFLRIPANKPLRGPPSV